MSNHCQNLDELLVAFAQAHGRTPALSQRVRTAVARLVGALDGGEPAAIGLDGYHGFPDALVRYLRSGGYARQTQRTYRSAIGQLLRWGLEAGLVEARPDPSVRAAWPVGPFVFETRQGRRRRRVARYERLAHGMAMRGRRPEDVTPADLMAYQDDLKQGRSGSKWRSEYRKLAGLCGRLADDGLLPAIAFPPLPAVRSAYGIPYEAWPKRLKEEFDAYAAWHTAPVTRPELHDYLAEHHPEDLSFFESVLAESEGKAVG